MMRNMLVSNIRFAGMSRFRLPTRLFSATADPNKEEDKKINTSYSIFTSLGQVIFLNSQTSGGVILTSLAIGDPYCALHGFLGSTVSVATAQGMQLDKDTIENGLLAYNGTLMGCVSAVLLYPSLSLSTFALTTAGAAACTALTASLGASVFTKQPQFTYAFNLVALSALWCRTPTAVSSSEAVAVSNSFVDVLTGSLHGVSQIFLVENSISGLGILGGIALYSPQLAVYAAGGSLLGTTLGATVYGGSVASGLWGYNAALSSMAVGVFWQPNTASRVLAVVAAVTSTHLFASAAQVMGPCLTLPFCLTMTSLLPLSSVVPSLKLADSPHSPEKN